MNCFELIREFRNLGCTNEAECDAAAKIYLDLRNVVKFKSLEYHYNSNLNLLYFQTVHEDGNVAFYFPVISTAPLDFSHFKEIQEKLQIKDKQCHFKLAICDPDSTILYYCLTSGL